MERHEEERPIEKKEEARRRGDMRASEGEGAKGMAPKDSTFFGGGGEDRSGEPPDRRIEEEESRSARESGARSQGQKGGKKLGEAIGREHERNPTTREDALRDERERL